MLWKNMAQAVIGPDGVLSDVWLDRDSPASAWSSTLYKQVSATINGSSESSSQSHMSSTPPLYKIRIDP